MQRQHIFVVNGSADFLDVVRDLLQDEHYNVTTTNFVPHTFKQIEIARPSLLIIDLIHGEMAGWDLLAELRHEAATRDIPVILVSTSKQLLEKAETERVIWAGWRSLLPEAVQSRGAAASHPGADRPGVTPATGRRVATAIVVRSC
jgi:CheY-like chemotaxis protein